MWRFPTEIACGRVRGEAMGKRKDRGTSPAAAEEGADRQRRQRTGEVVALGVVATHRAERVTLLARLHTLGDRHQRQRLA